MVRHGTDCGANRSVGKCRSALRTTEQKPRRRVVDVRNRLAALLACRRIGPVEIWPPPPQRMRFPSTDALIARLAAERRRFNKMLAILPKAVFFATHFFTRSDAPVAPGTKSEQSAQCRGVDDPNVGSGVAQCDGVAGLGSSGPYRPRYWSTGYLRAFFSSLVLIASDRSIPRALLRARA